MKKVFRLFLLIFISSITASLTSCDTSTMLYILNWDEYINEDLIEAFEEEYNCTVILDIAQSNETMFSKIVSDAAPYDIAFPSDYMVDQMINCDDSDIDTPIIKKLDYSKLSTDSKTYNPNDIFDPKLMSLIDSNCKELKEYCVPYFWGSLGIMYNKETLTQEQIAIIEEKGWAVLFEKELLGDVRIGMYASARDSIASALLYNGYSLNTRDFVELQKAGDSLGNMDYYAWATDDLKTGVVSRKYDLALVYSGDYFDMLISDYYDAFEDENIDIEEYEAGYGMFVPEVNNVFFDAMVIPENSQQTELAYEFIKFMIEYENAFMNATYVGYCPTQSRVLERMQLITDDPSDEYSGDYPLKLISGMSNYYPGNVQKGEIYKYLYTETYGVYDQIYKKVKK